MLVICNGCTNVQEMQGFSERFCPPSSSIERQSVGAPGNTFSSGANEFSLIVTQTPVPLLQVTNYLNIYGRASTTPLFEWCKNRICMHTYASENVNPCSFACTGTRPIMCRRFRKFHYRLKGSPEWGGWKWVFAYATPIGKYAE